MKTLAGLLLLVVAPLVAYATVPSIRSHSAVVYDVNQHQVLLEKNPDEVAPLASLTKLMTGMIVLGQGPVLEESLTIDNADVDQLKHSRSHIPVGATLTRKEMLRLALMSSENRAASALSRNIVGGQPAFTGRMNEKAKALGMSHTHFEDATGLSSQNVSTAHDLVKMTDAASYYPLIHEFTTLSHYEEEVGARLRQYRNSNRLIGRPGWDILLAKTGFTNEAGHCIVVKVSMPNGPVIIALMGAGSSGARSADLISIRNWLAGDDAGAATLRTYSAGTPTRHHKAMAVRRNSNRLLVAYTIRSASTAHEPNSRRKSGKRHHHHVRNSL